MKTTDGYDLVTLDGKTYLPIEKIATGKTNTDEFQARVTRSEKEIGCITQATTPTPGGFFHTGFITVRFLVPIAAIEEFRGIWNEEPPQPTQDEIAAKDEARKEMEGARTHFLIALAIGGPLFFYGSRFGGMDFINHGNAPIGMPAAAICIGAVSLFWGMFSFMRLFFISLRA